MTTEKIEADLEGLNKVFEEYTTGKSGVALPADCPCYIRFWRVVEDTGKNGRKLKAVVIELDFLFHGLNFYFRMGYGPEDAGELKLMSELGGEKELLGEWVKG